MPAARMPEAADAETRPAQRDEHRALSRLYSRQSAVIRSRICVVPRALQAPADDSQIFALRKCGNDYGLARMGADLTDEPLRPDGTYVFAIKASDPNTILLGKTTLFDTAIAAPARGQTPGEDADLAVEGHTSITHGEDVVYAGTAWFSKGALKGWSNSSGHYQPQAENRMQALTKFNQLLLPKEKFIAHHIR
ncbi:hypothetical protein FJU08_17370 [Martelella alba]|uniref:Uncharacterized protein n=1 Tax=Martelella alba TaxID=2590451 RepID=A0A506U672_9HYPH|nr:hypothetical protein [Martelella alba]TPW28574.1 hypothetical protein FJU08_17370 [Martelella alba]